MKQMDILYLYVTRRSIPSFRSLVWKSTEDKETLYLSKVKQELESRGFSLSPEEVKSFIIQLQDILEGCDKYDMTESFNKLDSIFELIAELQ